MFFIAGLVLVGRKSRLSNVPKITQLVGNKVRIMCRGTWQVKCRDSRARLPDPLFTTMSLYKVVTRRVLASWRSNEELMSEP